MTRRSTFLFSSRLAAVMALLSCAAPVLATPAKPPRVSRSACEPMCRGCQVLIDDGGKHTHAPHIATPVENALLRKELIRYLASPDCANEEYALKPDEVDTDHDALSGHRIDDALDGSFTGPHLHETLFLFHLGVCGNEGFGYQAGGARLFVVVRDGQIVLSTPNEGFYFGIETAVDVDGDGTSDVVVMSGSTWGGYEHFEAGVFSFAGGRGVELKHWSAISGGDCSGKGTGHSSTTVTFRPGDGAHVPPCFREVVHTQKCRRD